SIGASYVSRCNPCNSEGTISTTAMVTFVLENDLPIAVVVLNFTTTYCFYHFSALLSLSKLLLLAASRGLRRTVQHPASAPHLFPRQQLPRGISPARIFSNHFSWVG